MKFIQPRAEFSRCLLLLLAVLLAGCKSRSIILDDAKVKSPSEYVEAAQNYYNQGSFRKAIGMYERLIAKYTPERENYEKDLAWANYEIGFCYLVMHQYSKATVYFEKVINDYNQLAAKTLAEGRITEMTKRREKADREAEKKEERKNKPPREKRKKPLISPTQAD